MSAMICLCWNRPFKLNTIYYFISSNILPCSSVGTYKYGSELKSVWDILRGQDGRTSSAT